MYRLTSYSTTVLCQTMAHTPCHMSQLYCANQQTLHVMCHNSTVPTNRHTLHVTCHSCTVPTNRHTFHVTCHKSTVPTNRHTLHVTCHSCTVPTNRHTMSHVTTLLCQPTGTHSMSHVTAVLCQPTDTPCHMSQLYCANQQTLPVTDHLLTPHFHTQAVLQCNLSLQIAQNVWPFPQVPPHTFSDSILRQALSASCLIPSRAPTTITLQYNNVYPQSHLKVHYQTPTKSTLKHPVHMSSHLNWGLSVLSN